MYENRSTPLLSRRKFLVRLALSLATAVLILVVSLAIGMWGYHYFEGLAWVDSFVNAAMILSGMGPVSTLQTNHGKVFAGCYALFSGLAFLTTIGVVVAPLFHRFLHKFHLDASTRSTTTKT